MPANPSDALARKVEEAVRAYDTLSQTRAKVAALVRAEVEACAVILDEHANNMQREAELERVGHDRKFERVLRAVSVGIRASAAAIRARGGAKEQ